MLPVPLAAKPIAVLEFVQLKVEPAGVLAKAAGLIVAPAQTVISCRGVATRVALMVIEKTILGPVQPFNKGVTVIVPERSLPVELTGALYTVIFPVPVVGRPIEA